MKLSNELTKLFLAGGKVVHKETYTCKTYLIRMPKDEFIQDERSDYLDNKFEYAWAQSNSDNDTIEVGGYLNESLPMARKKMNEKHIDTCEVIWAKVDRK